MKRFLSSQDQSQSQSLPLAVVASDKIDELTSALVDLRDRLEEFLDMPYQHPTISGMQKQELNRRFNEMVDGLQALRSEIIKCEMSDKDLSDFLSWLKNLAKFVLDYVGFPTA